LQRRVSGFIEIKAGSHKTPARRPQARKKSVPEENGKRREEEFCRNLEKKTEREEDNKFKPADSPHFQTAADRCLVFPLSKPLFQTISPYDFRCSLFNGWWFSHGSKTGRINYGGMCSDFRQE
jgi:hypothetical protein